MTPCCNPPDEIPAVHSAAEYPESPSSEITGSLERVDAASVLRLRVGRQCTSVWRFVLCRRPPWRQETALYRQGSWFILQLLLRLPLS